MNDLEHIVVWERAVLGSRIPFLWFDDHTLLVSHADGSIVVEVVDSLGHIHDDGLYLLRADTGFEAVLVSAGDERRIDVTYVPRGAALYERNMGVFESDALGQAHVAIVGLGSGGSAVLRELVRSGIGRFTLIDGDRLSPGNICRHELGLSDVGRVKVHALRDYVLDRNPAAEVDAVPIALDGSNLPDVYREFEADPPDVLVCATDSRESRLLVNRIGVLLGTYTLFGAVRHRAYAGDVLQVVPGVTPCYQCFVSSLPATAATSPLDLSLVGDIPSYADRPTSVEPGLSIDIAPVSVLMAKLALTELFRGKGSRRFDLLAEDLVAPAFFWLSRREPGSSYEQWPVLADSVGEGPRILQWIGRWLERDESCPVCAPEVITPSHCLQTTRSTSC